MKKFYSYLVMVMAFSAMLFTVGCSDDKKEEDDILPPEELNNAYRFDGQTTDVKSVFIEHIGNNLHVYLSPAEAENYKALTATDENNQYAHEFIEIIIDNSLIGKTVNLKNCPDATYEVHNATLTAVNFKSATNSVNDNIKSGSLSIVLDSQNGKANTHFLITLADDKVFEAKCESAYLAPIAINNQIIIGDKTFDIKSIFFEDYLGKKMAFMSPEPLSDHIKGWEDLLANGYEYVMVMMDDSLVNTNINVLAEDAAYFSVFSNMIDGFEGISNQSKEMVNNGSVKINIDSNNNANASIEIYFADGTSIAAGGTGIYKKPNPANTFTVDDKTDLILSSFYEEKPGIIALYFSPQKCVDGEQATESAMQYAKIVIDESSFNKEINVTGTTLDYEFYYSYDFGVINGGGMKSISMGNANGATGALKVICNDKATRNYTVTADITFGDGQRVKLAYTGTINPFVTPPANEFTIQGKNPKAINSAIADITNAEKYTVWMSSDAGLTTIEQMQSAQDVVKITINSEFATGDRHGFSQDENMSITFNNTVYSSASENAGTISFKITDNTASIYFKEWDIILEGNYNGPITIIK